MQMHQKYNVILLNAITCLFELILYNLITRHNKAFHSIAFMVRAIKSVVIVTEPAFTVVILVCRHGQISETEQ